MNRSLWSEKYRPHTIEDYVWRDDALKVKVEQWIRDRIVPHVLFSGDPGTGKTSLAYLLLEQIGITDADILYIPASRYNKTDDIIEQIRNFVTVWAENDTDMRYVILDEADSITWQAQGRLRADMDIYEANTRFILTCNYPKNVIKPIKSRCEHYHFQRLDHDQFAMRLVDIMRAERLDVGQIDNIQVMSQIVDQCYPDLRRSIGMLQKCTQESADGRRKLVAPSDDDASEKPYMFTVADHFAAGNYREARTVVLRNMQSDEDFIEAFRWLYQHIDVLGKTEDTQDQILLAIRKGLVAHNTAAIPEINLSATLTEISMIAKSES